MTWFNRQLVITASMLLGTVAFFELTHADLLLQDLFFNFSNGHWLLDRDEPVSRFFLYDGIRVVYGCAALALLAVLLVCRRRPLIRAHRRGLLIVCLSMVLVPGAINFAKAVTNVPCPADLQHYGGDYPLVTLLTAYPEDFVQERNIRCYPAGHASGGFALLSLFFLFRAPRARRQAVAGALTLAWSAGLYKMLIGDHFLSHTLVTMLLSWLLILVIARVVDPQAAARLARDAGAEPSCTALAAHNEAVNP